MEKKRQNRPALVREYESWRRNSYSRAGEDRGARSGFSTVSGRPIKELYTPVDLPGFDYLRDLRFPGEYPYTRGVHPTMYRGRPWTMRQFSGFGTAEDTNTRYKYLLAHGQTGLSVAFHLPTLMGLDSDHPLARGEVGKCGVAVDTLADMEVLFDGLPLDKITTSMTINAPAAVLWAMYIAVAEKQGVPARVIAGTIQNDILKEYIAQKTFVFPPRPSMKLIVDTFEFGSGKFPRWNTISISGYHIREAGSTAAQELAFTLRDGIEYVEWALERGLKVDEFAPRLSYFFNSHNDFFEEIAKFRAARRIWAEVMRDRFGARQPRSWWLRFHTQTSGVSLTAQQPYNNIVRVALQALAAVLGGTQSLHTNSLDETYALPSEDAVTIALRTQQVIAHESGVTNTIDPLGGSYFVEALTNDLEREAKDYIRRIDKMGGMVKAIELGFPQKEVADSAYSYQKAVEARDKVIVGVNAFEMAHEPIPLLEINETAARQHLARLRAVKKARHRARARRALADLKRAARDELNLMPQLLICVKAYATLGEIMDTLKDVYGEYEEPVTFLGGFMPGKKIRVLIAKPGLDGHDRGAKVICRALRDAGMEVIYTGLRRTPEEIVSAAIQEDVDVIGLSILSGAHPILFPKIISLLRRNKAGDIPVIAGGIIPEKDIARMKKAGIQEIFLPGTTTQAIVDWITARLAGAKKIEFRRF